MTEAQIEKMTEKMKKWIDSDDFIRFVDEKNAKEKESNLKTRELIINCEWIKWAVGYLQTHPNFHNDWWFQPANKPLEYDQARIDCLEKVFNAIDRYAKNNGIEIYVDPSEDRNLFYRVNYEDTIIQFGIYYNPESNNICTIAKDDGLKAIDYNDIIEYVQQPEFIERKVLELKK